jgi:hypothetical protein
MVYKKHSTLDPRLSVRGKGTEALGRLIAEDFEKNTTLDTIEGLFDKARLSSETQGRLNSFRLFHWALVQS